MTTFSLPLFAQSGPPEAAAVKTELTDEQLKEAVGAGQVDAILADYNVGGEPAQALFVNRTSQNLNYSLSVINISGVVLETIESGMIASGTAKIVSGTPTLGGPGGSNQVVQAKLWHAGLPGLQSKDTSWARTVIDNDGDGMTNVVEIANGLNPNLNDAGLDNDRDFLTNYEEVILLGTNPNVADAGLAPDTDGDGVVDKVELALGTNPEEQDSLGLDSEDLKYTMHVLNRLTFGPTNSLVTEINEKTIPVWIEEQLLPIGLDEMLPDPAQVLRDSYVVRFSEETHRVGPMRHTHDGIVLDAVEYLFERIG